VETRLLVGSSKDSRLLVLLRKKSSGEVELQALSHVILKLELVAEDIGRGPSLGDDEPVLAVRVLGLDVTSDVGALRVTSTSNAEGSVGRRRGLDLERGAVEGVVLAEQVARRLAEILRVAGRLVRARRVDHLDCIPSRTAGQAGEET
jgi:hypothetical protein